MKLFIIILLRLAVGFRTENNVLLFAQVPACAEPRSIHVLFEEAKIVRAEQYPSFSRLVQKDLVLWERMRLNVSILDTPLQQLSVRVRRFLAPRAIAAAIEIARNTTIEVKIWEYPHLEIDVLQTSLLPDDLIGLVIANQMPCLEFAEPSYSFDLMAHDSLPREPLRRLAGDNFVGSQWNLDAFPGVAAKEAWKNSTGYDHFTVAILDSGCSAHPDLVDNLCLKGRDDASCLGYDFGDDDDNPHDENLQNIHGTPVAGTAAATGLNAWGVAGVCWSCRIMCIKIIDLQGWTTITYLLAAYDYMIEKKVKLSNNSYGAYTGLSQAMQRGLLKLNQAGHLFIASAGNDACDLDDPEKYAKCGKTLSPGGMILPNIITVGASTQEGTPSAFSNFGNTSVDLFAPGEHILTLHNTLANVGDGYFRYTAGTSFAAPQVAGAAALLWSINPNMTHYTVRRHIMLGVHVVPQLAGLSRSGGILDVAASLHLAGGDGGIGHPFPIPPPETDITNIYYGLPSTPIEDVFLPGAAYLSAPLMGLYVGPLLAACV